MVVVTAVARSLEAMVAAACSLAVVALGCPRGGALRMRATLQLSGRHRIRVSKVNSSK
jgi:hypothetical protein